MSWKVLVSAPYMLPVIDRFDGFFREHGIDITVANVVERMEESDLLPIIAEFDGVICGDDRFTEKVLEAATRLKVISKWGTGIDSIDSVAAAARGIRICRTPGAFTHPVADSVLGYILCFVRALPRMDAMMKQGTWDKIPGRALNECTLGVVGVGAIGLAVLRRAAPFGMRLIGNDIRKLDAKDLAGLDVEMTGLDDLLAQSDFVTLHCDLNPTSHHLMSTGQFSAMKQSAFLLNLSRGPAVDEPALIAALRTGAIAGAAMDVFEDEPLPAASPLRAMENVMLAPHNSNSSPAAWERVHENTLNNLLDGLKAG
jgi:phosphoglycerate dehydrogenase-like enzyme